MSILNGEAFKLSSNDYDWLGSGAYFFEFAPALAERWAAERHDDAGCVLRAEISLEGCLNLADIEGAEVLREYFASYEATFGLHAMKQARQTEMARRLDCAVINYACAREAEQGRPVISVRGAFHEGEPIWSHVGLSRPRSSARFARVRPTSRFVRRKGAASFASGIYERAHVQICVRAPNVAIVDIALEGAEAPE